MRASVAALLLLLLAAGAAFAQPQDRALERRTQALAHELRCLVCQNQSLAESNAPLAVDLRNRIREQLAAGASEEQVLDFMVERFGDFVLYRPPFKASTLALWTGPFALLALGAVIAWRRVRRRAAAPRLTEAERARAAQLLE